MASSGWYGDTGKESPAWTTRTPAWMGCVSMSPERNLTLVRRALMEVWNGGNLELADRLFDPSYINHGGIIPDLVTGPESMKFAVVLQHTAFPRLEVRERGVAAEGNVVKLKWVARRFPASGGNADRAPIFVARGTTLIRCAGNQIAESWTTWDCPAHRDGTGVDSSLRLSVWPYRLAG